MHWHCARECHKRHRSDGTRCSDTSYGEPPSSVRCSLPRADCVERATDYMRSVMSEFGRTT